MFRKLVTEPLSYSMIKISNVSQEKIFQIWELTKEYLPRLDAGSWFDESYSHARIPTLENVITQTESKIKLNIELKSHGHERDFLNTVAKLIKEYDYYDQCVVTSLDYDLLNAIEDIDPKIKTGYVMFMAYGNLSELNVDFYSVEETVVNQRFVDKAHAVGREVHVWTINERDDMIKMIEMGVDNIITDYDKDLADLLLELEKNTDGMAIERILDNML